jgi:hypothetical protein
MLSMQETIVGLDREPTTKKNSSGITKQQEGILTNKCKPPRPAAFFRRPCKPTNMLNFVQLLPVTITLAGQGDTLSSSSPIS